MFENDYMTALSRYFPMTAAPAVAQSPYLTGSLQNIMQSPVAAPIESSLPSYVNPNPAAPAGGSWRDGFLGKTDMKTGIKTDGWGGMALGGLQALGGAFMGMKQYGLAKQQLSEGKRQFNLNYDAQRSTTNAQLEDRQRARLASNPGAYQSVGTYMNQYGIK